MSELISQSPIELLPIRITAIKGNWRLYQLRKKNKKFLLLKKNVLKRDKYNCRYCGFFAKEYQEVINIDQNYRNNHIDNLATACVFCAQCFFVDSLGMSNESGGHIIYLPEMSQASLNNICRVLFCSADKDSAYRGRLKAVVLSLQDRTKEVQNCFGPQADDPKVFGQAWIDAKLPPHAQQHDVLNNLRLLPNKHAFKTQIDYWKKTIFAKVPI